MKRIIITQEQSDKLAEILNEWNFKEPGPQSPDMKKTNKPYCVNPEKVLIVKKFLDKGFTPHDYEKIGENGLPTKIKVVSMNASNGEPLKWLYQDQLQDLLIDHFQNMFLDHNERALFMAQVLKDWLNGAIGVHGNLSVNRLMENREDEWTTFHGGSNNFKQFNLDYSGTGHGASKYGYGVYLTFNEEDGKFYAQQSMHNNNKQNGYVYSVEVPDDNGKNYIDFENQEGTAIVKNAVFALLMQYYTNKGYNEIKAKEWATDDIESGCKNVSTLLNTIEISTDGELNRKDISDYLSKQGYIGFKVPSQNYLVIFNPANTKILQSSGIQYNPNYEHPTFGKVMEGTINEVTSEEVTAEANVANLYPTDPQKEAGNYKMGHVRIKGMPITIENPMGSHRTGTDKNGNPWDVEMQNHYGYFGKTNGKGKDGDAVDVFIGPDIETFDKVYVIDQKVDGQFDESKVMLGFLSKDAAVSAYNSNYSADWKGLWKVTGVSLDVFKKWLYRGRKQRQPFCKYVAIQKKKLEEQRINEEEYNELRPIARVSNEEEARDMVEYIKDAGIEAYCENGIVYISVEQDTIDPYYVDEMVQYCKKLAKEFHEQHSAMPAAALTEDVSMRDMYFNMIDNPDHPRHDEPAYNGWKRVRRRPDHKMNLRNEDGEYLCDEWYDWIGYLIKGLAIVEKDGQYNLVNDQGQTVLPEWHEDVIDKNSDGESYVIIDGKEQQILTRDSLLLK